MVVVFGLAADLLGDALDHFGQGFAGDACLAADGNAANHRLFCGGGYEYPEPSPNGARHNRRHFEGRISIVPVVGSGFGQNFREYSLADKVVYLLFGMPRHLGDAEFGA